MHHPSIFLIKGACMHFLIDFNGISNSKLDKGSGGVHTNVLPSNLPQIPNLGIHKK